MRWNELGLLAALAIGGSASAQVVTKSTPSAKAGASSDTGQAPAATKAPSATKAPAGAPGQSRLD